MQVHGLSAEELSAETLYPGDTIEYFSMAFVNGDPRGHRVAKVLRVLRDEPEYPLRLESQEMLPITLMIRRKRDRHDDEIDPALAKWRKIRTFKLVVGEVKGKTRADRLNEGLRESMASALQATKTALAARSSDSRTQSGGAVTTEEPATAKPKKQSKPEPKPERLQQQKLSFTAASSKRVSLDSASKRPSPASDRRPRPEERAALKHKKPRSLPSPPRARALRDSPHGRKAGGKRPLRENKFFPAETRKPQRKMELTKFMDHLEEKMASHKTTLDEYLELRETQKSALESCTRPQTPSALDESSGRSRGASDSGRRHQDHEKRCTKLKVERTMAAWLAKAKKSAPPTPPGPPKRQSLDQPRSAPDRHKSPLRSTLSFGMAGGAGGSSSGSSQSSSHAAGARKERTRPSRDADDEKQRKRKLSSDFSSPARRPSQSSDRRGDRQARREFMGQWVARK